MEAKYANINYYFTGKENDTITGKNLRIKDSNVVDTAPECREGTDSRINNPESGTPDGLKIVNQAYFRSLISWVFAFLIPRFESEVRIL